MSKKAPKIKVASAEEVAQYTSAERAPAENEPRAETVESTNRDESASPQAQLKELQDKFLRAKAEGQNIARRAREEKAEALRYGNAELLRGLLGVVDDFERALEAADETDQGQTVVEGVRMVYDKLMKLLADQGVEAIDAEGLPFNPAEHAAMMQQPSETCAPGTVLRQVQRGYRHHDRVLRPAQVIVAQASAAEQPGASPNAMDG